MAHHDPNGDRSARWHVGTGGGYSTCSASMRGTSTHCSLAADYDDQQRNSVTDQPTRQP
jgi:hypothetical protein